MQIVQETPALSASVKRRIESGDTGFSGLSDSFNLCCFPNSRCVSYPLGVSDGFTAE